MAEKARHAYGNSENLSAALQSGAINSYDILFLDGETNPKIGWVDKGGAVRLVEGKKQILRVDKLPTTDGNEDVVYIYNNEGYIWNADTSACIPLSKSADLTALEDQVAELEAQLEDKVDTNTVQSMIEEYSEAEIIEF